jgi:hypothetical protein
MSWWYNDYPKPKPRKPADGIKAQSKKFGQTWWASKWLAALERLMDSGRLSRGRSYARSGQVLNLDIKPGRVDAKVQGSAPRPYKVQIEIKPLSEKEWNRVADAMAEQALQVIKPIDDVRASAEYRRDMTRMLCRRLAHSLLEPNGNSNAGGVQ